MRYVLLALLVVGSSIAHAEGNMLPGGATIEFNKLLIHKDNSPDLTEPEPDTETLWHYFNFAHCECSHTQIAEPKADFREGTFTWELVVKNFSVAINQPVQVWTGTSCDDEIKRPMNCTIVTSTPNISLIEQNNGTRVDIPIYNLMQPKGGACQEIEQSAATWLLADGFGVGTLEYSNSKSIAVDTKPPPLPTNFKAVSAENAIDISWTAPDAADVAFYQAICAEMPAGTAGKTDRPAPRYVTPRQLCGAPSDPFFTLTSNGEAADVDAGDGTPVLPTGWTEANPMYLCAENTVPTAKGIRIEGLKNGTQYLVGVLVIDKYGNAQGTYFTNPITPQPATDFWEDLHDHGSDVEGGFCLLSQTYGDSSPLTDALRSFRDHTLADTAYGRWLIDVYYATLGSLDLHGSSVLRVIAGVLLLPLVVVALLWYLLTLPGLVGLVALLVLVRKKRLRIGRLATAASTIAVVALLPARAHAQAPYWEETELGNQSTELPPGDPERVQWHAGLRLGPYVPGIDDQVNMPIGKFAGPYEQMFGGNSWLPMLDVERMLWRGAGQLGVGVSIGYLGKKARAWQGTGDSMNPDRPRTPGDENKFRMIPLSLNATYRFTYLDDAFGIPVVPYARGGLAYYVWWITAPNGDIARSCIGPNTGAMCETTKGAGASLGVVGAIGLSIRAERIDASAARSMRESGIEHAGFYAELNMGKVDGFGSDKKLSVGDTTWFAGVDFEF